MAEKARAFGKGARDTFLAHLATTANVAASARVAGVPSHRVYRERGTNPAFRDAWQDALAEGYTLLESELLAEALRPASSSLKDMTLKTRQMKIRLGMSLLSLHRASVRGEKPAKSLPAVQTTDEIRRRVSERLHLMRARLQNVAECEDHAAE